ncbi:bifunctional adenosylcobinamide kinase/adenosylcobinamide-phosphate guanylyltransferase [Seleniivibrio woodruffii]|uniref:bifunctional adenosylcobinamide kinase/adenosylcobinamide-phosphate guanylyltransferase n=1 Tax=Seleniivibrio woodruffii TaxID=1078050 RepID=UPI002409EAC4|nr:bifunctional adenosylcobinamide kinase/adenosylcobinamide-phosphate guanylyltransferase [Seleniivibrio woodruffii]
MITLITGGVKSGKTAHALKLCDAYTGKTYVATAEAFDEAMQTKIDLHKAERDESWVTIEEPVSLHSVFDNAQEQDVILIDCITMWLNNLIYKQLNTEKHIEHFLARLAKCGKPVVLVTNETGLGVMPANPDACRFADELGRLNTKLAAMSDEVIFMISSIPLTIKGAKK